MLDVSASVWYADGLLVPVVFVGGSAPVIAGIVVDEKEVAGWTRDWMYIATSGLSSNRVSAAYSHK